MAEKIPVSVDASWPPQAGAKVEYELNGRWFPGCISMASPTTLYFQYAARRYKQYEEPIERDDLARLRPQRRLRRGNVLLHGWPAAAVELLSRRLPEPLASPSPMRAGASASYAYHSAEWGRSSAPSWRSMVNASSWRRRAPEVNFSIMFYSLETGRCVRTLKNDLTKFSETDRFPCFVDHRLLPGAGPAVVQRVHRPNLPGRRWRLVSVVDLATGEVRWIESSWRRGDGAYASSKVQAHAVTANQQDECKIHDLATGETIRSGDLIDDAIYFDEEIYMRVSPDGSRALLMRTHERSSVESWSLGAQGAGAGDHHVLEHSGPWGVQRLCPTNGAHVLTLTERELRIWDRTTGECVRTIDQPSDDEDFNFMDVCVTPDGARAVTASCKTMRSNSNGEVAPLDGRSPNMTFYVWNLHTGERLRFFRLASVDQRGVQPDMWAAAMDITPDGNWLVVKSNGSYGVYWI